MLPFPLLKRQKDKMGYELTLENCKTEQHQWAENRWLIKNIDLLVSFPTKTSSEACTTIAPFLVCCKKFQREQKNCVNSNSSLDEPQSIKTCVKSRSHLNKKWRSLHSNSDGKGYQHWSAKNQDLNSTKNWRLWHTRWYFKGQHWKLSHNQV